MFTPNDFEPYASTASVGQLGAGLREAYNHAHGAHLRCEAVEVRVTELERRIRRECRVTHRRRRIP